MKPFSIVSCALFVAGISRADPVAIRWTAETSRPAPVDIPAFQGETIYIEPAFATYGTALTLSNCTAALYWQTNGMASAWWSVPASIVPGDPVRVRAIWSPTNDVGATRYTYFLGVASSAGAAYRAYGTLMMRAAPGATPSVLAAPTTLTDAMAAWADSRYDTAGAAQAVSNALTGHTNDPAAHPDIREAIDAATNALAGNIMGGDLPVQRWMMFDFGVSSNRWLILTNDVLEIWEQ